MGSSVEKKADPYQGGIIRRQRTTWTSVDNSIINDTRLGLKPLGLLVYMLSKPNDWKFSQEHLGRVWGEGRDAMRSMMKTLQACGYVRREYVHDDHGHIRTVTIVSELPEQPADGCTEGRVSRQSVEPPVVDPSVGQPVCIVKTDLDKELKVETSPDGEVGKADLPAKPESDPLDRCPHDQIVSLYHEALPELPRCRLMSDARRRALTAFWRWVATSKKSDGSRRASTREQALEWIKAYFVRASQNDFVMGRTARGSGHESWRADFDFLLTEKGKKWVIEKTVDAA
jgi:hypothetical protein